MCSLTGRKERKKQGKGKEEWRRENRKTARQAEKKEKKEGESKFITIRNQNQV